MAVNVEALVRQAIRWKSAIHATSTLETAHALLEKLPPDQRAHVFVEFSFGREWQFVFERKLVKHGSFEDCVVAFAEMFIPPIGGGHEVGECNG